MKMIEIEKMKIMMVMVGCGERERGKKYARRYWTAAEGSSPSRAMEVRNTK